MRSEGLVMQPISVGVVLMLVAMGASVHAADVNDATSRRGGSSPTIPRQTPSTDFGSRVQQGAPGLALAEAQALQRQIDIAVEKSVAATNALSTVGSTDRQELQAICNSLNMNPGNADAQRRLANWLARHKGVQASVIAQFCLAVPYRDLQTAVGGRVRTLQRGGTDSGTQMESRRYQSLSALLKAINDTAQSTINNMK